MCVMIVCKSVSDTFSNIDMPSLNNFFCMIKYYNGNFEIQLNN